MIKNSKALFLFESRPLSGLNDVLKRVIWDVELQLDIHSHIMAVMNRHMKYTAYSLIAVGLASFVAHTVYFGWLAGNRPGRPEPEAGYTQLINNHGSCHYITEKEETILIALEIPAVAGVLAIVVLGWNARTRNNPRSS